MSFDNASNYTLIAGFIAALVSMVGAVASTALVQALQGAVPDFELSAFRSIAPGPTYFLLGKASGADFRITRLHIMPLVALSVLYVAYNVGYFGSATYIPLAEVVGISNIFTIISAMALAKIAFKRGVRKVDLISLFLCSFSFLLLIQPPWLFQSSAQSNSNISFQKTENESAFGNQSMYADSSLGHSSVTLTLSKSTSTGYILAIVGGLAQGMCYEVNAVLLDDIQPVVKTTYFTLLYFVISIVISLYLEAFATSFTTYQLLLIIGHSVGAGINDYFTIYTVHTIGAVRAGLFYSLEIVMFIFVQFTFMKTIMPSHENWVEVVGVIVMVLGAAVSPTHDILQNFRGVNSLP